MTVHKISTVILGILLGLGLLVILVSALASEDVDYLCAVDGKFLKRIDGQWVCSDANWTTTNVTDLFVNQTGDLMTGSLRFSGAGSNIEHDTDLDLYPDGQTTFGLRVDQDGSSLILQALGTDVINLVDDLHVSTEVLFDDKENLTFGDDWTIYNDGNFLTLDRHPGKIGSILINDGALTLNHNSLSVQSDNGRLNLGNSNDAYFRYNGSELLVNPQSVGSGNVIQEWGNFKVQGGTGADCGTTGGWIEAGKLNDKSIKIDDNEIMACGYGSPADLYVQTDGGNLYVGALVGDPEIILGQSADTQLYIGETYIEATDNYADSTLDLNPDGGIVRVGHTSSGELSINDPDAVSSAPLQIESHPSSRLMWLQEFEDSEYWNVSIFTDGNLSFDNKDLDNNVMVNGNSLVFEEETQDLIIWAERGTVVSSQYWALGNGQSPRGAPFMLDGYNITSISGVCSNAVGTTLTLHADLNGASVGSVTIGNSLNTVYNNSNLNSEVNAGDVIGIRAGVETGSYLECVGAVTLQKVIKTVRYG